MKFILGKKLEMSQLFSDKGEVIPVTLVQAGPCVITQIKNQDKDKYSAVQIGFDNKKKLSSALKGHLKDLEKFRYIREFRTQNSDNSQQENEKLNLKRGDKITVNTFEVGDIVKIIGTSKGKGFQGVVKRHGFHGSPASHGHKDQLRMPGSSGPTEPARVFKGKRMPGHMGDARITVKNLEIVKIDEENNILYIKGAVPGARNGLLEIVGGGELKVNQEKIKKEESKSPKDTEKEDKKITEKQNNKEEKKLEIKKEEKLAPEISHEKEKEDNKKDIKDIKKEESKEKGEKGK